jgi:hypothetical protein
MIAGAVILAALIEILDLLCIYRKQSNNLNPYVI